MIAQIKERISLFLTKWYSRFKTFVYLFAIWAVIHSSISICEFSVAFEYDDGLAYTTDSYLKAKNLTGDEFYKTLNENASSDRVKIIPFLIYKTLKILGFSVEIIADRKNLSPEKLISRWHGLKIHFVASSNEKYEILNSKRYLIFFANSDDGVIQARKAGVYPIRIKRNPKSLNPLPYNPSLFGEKVIPLSEF